MQNLTPLQKNPNKVKVEKGTTYYWCSCGLSQKHPYCDWTHKKDEIFKSFKYVPTSNKVVFFATVN